MMQQTILVRALARISCAWSVLNVILKLGISLLFSFFLQVIDNIVCYTAVFSVVTGGALRDDTKNGCVADYIQYSEIQFTFTVLVLIDIGDF